MSISVKILEQYGNVRRSVGRMAVHFLRDLELGPKQLIAIRLVGKKKKCTMAEIAEGTNTDKASVTRIISTLVEAGWLNREYGTLDRRQVLVTLSAKGVRNLAKIEMIYARIAERFASTLKPQEQNELLRLLLKIESGLTDKEFTVDQTINLES